MTGSTTSTTQACAACKFQRRKCSPDCPLAPYFPADHPKQFLNVHKLYGVGNTLRILKQVEPTKRNDAMKSILYEADARDRDPVHGCFGIITLLQGQAEMLREELEYVRTQTHLMEQQQSLAYYNQHQQQQQPLPQQHLHSFSNQPMTLSTTSADSLNAGIMLNWQHQGTSAGTTPTAVPNWLYQYMATSPHMQNQMQDAYPNNITCSGAGGLMLKQTTLDVRPSLNIRSVADYELQQHSFHDSAPKAETYESSTGESSIKDPESLEHDELESAAALFTLTSGSHG